MPSVLYIVSKSAQSWPDYQFVLNPQESDYQKTVVLIEDGVIEDEFPADQIFRLEENKNKNVDNSTKKIPSITYRELLDLVFSADHLVVV